MADHIKDLPAGAARLVRNLYSSGKTKEIGLSYSQKNRDRIEESKANGTFVPNPVDPKKTEVPFARPIVPVPKVGGGGGNRANSGDAAATSPSSSGNFYRPHRRPYDEIKEELDRRIQENMEETRSYRPRGPLMDEKEKTRLATLNEWNGKPPEEVMQAALSGVKLPSRPPRERVSERQELETMFSRVMNEIEERRDFLAEMERQGKAAKYSNLLQREIQERIGELNKIDRLLKSAPK